MAFIVSEKEGPNGLLLVVTDKEILGKTFEEGKLHLDLTHEFYQGEEKTHDEVENLFTKARDIHLTGKESVALGIEKNLVNSDKVLWVQGIPHAEVVMSE